MKRLNKSGMELLAGIADIMIRAPKWDKYVEEEKPYSWEDFWEDAEQAVCLATGHGFER